MSFSKKVFAYKGRYPSTYFLEQNFKLIFKFKNVFDTQQTICKPYVYITKLEYYARGGWVDLCREPRRFKRFIWNWLYSFTRLLLNCRDKWIKRNNNLKEWNHWAKSRNKYRMSSFNIKALSFYLLEICLANKIRFNLVLKHS